MPLNLSNVRVGAPKASLVTFPSAIMEEHGAFGRDPVGFFPIGDARTRAFLAWIDRIGPFDNPRTDDLEADECHKQMVVYSILKVGDKVLYYRRTKKGSDSRLAGAYSVGVGGHVEVGDIPANAMSMAGAAYRASTRELREELAEGAFGPLGDQATLNLNIVGVIFDSTNHVGRCHFGIVVRAVPDYIDPDGIRPAEGSNITGLGLVRPIDVPSVGLERWSELLMPSLVSGLF